VPPRRAVPAAHRPALAARFSPEPGPRRVPNTPHSPGARTRPTTRSLVDAPTITLIFRPVRRNFLSIRPDSSKRRLDRSTLRYHELIEERRIDLEGLSRAEPEFVLLEQSHQPDAVY